MTSLVHSVTLDTADGNVQNPSFSICEVYERAEKLNIFAVFYKR